MTYEEMLEDIKQLKNEKKQYEEGKIDDGMSPECRAQWIDKCNS